MGNFEIIAEAVERLNRSSLLTSTAIYSTIELIEGEIISFYVDLPKNNETEGTGRIVVVTEQSIVETTMQLPKGWDFYDRSQDLDTIKILSRRVSNESIMEVKLTSSPRYWESDIQKRSLAGVEVSAKITGEDEIIVVFPNRYPDSHTTQDLEKTLKVLGHTKRSKV